jgi:hypothetical protein
MRRIGRNLRGVARCLGAYPAANDDADRTTQQGDECCRY